LPQNEVKRLFDEKFSQLPKPKNKYQVVVPEFSRSLKEKDEADENLEDELEDDSSDVFLAKQHKLMLEEQEKLKRRSGAIKRNLPRPFAINKGILKEHNPTEHVSLLDQAHDLIQAEMIKLMTHDAINHPIAHKRFKPPTSADVDPHFDIVSSDELSMAREEISRELVVLKEESGGEVEIEAYRAAWESNCDKYIFVPSRRSSESTETLAQDQLLEGLQFQFQKLKDDVEAEFQNTKKLDGKLNVLLKGYERRSKGLFGEIKELQQQIVQNEIETQCFEELRRLERDGIESRMNSINKYLEMVKTRETSLQARYAKLLESKERETLLLQGSV